MRRVVLVIAAVAFGPWLAAPALAQPGGGGPTNDDCLVCHSEPTFTRADGSSVYVSAERFATSTHGGFSCVDCHADLAAPDEFPHADTVGAVVCALCHGEASAEYEKSIHALAREGGVSLAATCADCHGTHDIRAPSDPESRVYHLSLPATCGRCHGDLDIIQRGHIEIGDVFSRFQDSIHGRALSRSGLIVAPNCSDCHGTHDIERKTSLASRVYRTNVPATCGRCHEGVERQYATSIHGTALANGDPTVPVCQDCHSAHEIQRADTEAWRLDVIRECGTCHVESIRTYRDTFHGQVTALGFTRVAACADCHTSHEIFPTEDSRSSVALGNLVSTCQRCHPGANANFARYDPHADKYNYERNPLLYYARRFMQGLLFFVFAFFGLHTTLWASREFVNRRHQAGAGARPDPSAQNRDLDLGEEDR